jgi:8-oxo-dGTP diphosphatase
MANQRRAMPVIVVVTNDEGKILMSQRHEYTNPFHGLWQLPGGGIEFGEHPKDTALREVREEVGLTVKLLTQHPFVFSYVSPDGDAHTIVLGYIAKHIAGEVDTSKDRNTGDAKWFTFEEIRRIDCVPLVKEVLREAHFILAEKDAR